MSGGAVFLTGATGALGPWIAQRALASGLGVRALARATAGQSARDRVECAMAVLIGRPLASRLEVVEGDLRDEHLDPGPVDLVIHCAACTEFGERSAGVSYQTNVEGTKRLLGLARRRQVPVVHVSTAYVCGTRSGPVFEGELDVGQGFNNVYERSKNEGEALVHEWSSQTGLPAIVLRPSIVLGDGVQGRAVRFSTLYPLLAALDAVAPSLRSQRVRIVGQPGVTKNIVPVDYFAATAWQIIQRGVPGTYHITHPEPPSMDDLRGILAELFDLDLRLVSAEAFGGERASSIERTCHHVMAPYRPYMVDPEPQFDRRSTLEVVAGHAAGPGKLDADYFRRLLEYGRWANWGRDVLVPLDGDESAGRVREYFEVFLPAWTNQSLLPDLRRLSARLSISIDDQLDSTWWLDLQDGVLRSVRREGSPSACAFAMDPVTFLEIVSGQLVPQRAFFAGRIRITGNIELGLKVATVLSKFFSQHPFAAELV